MKSAEPQANRKPELHHSVGRYPEIATDFHPWRRNVDFLECAEMPIRPPLERLDSIEDKSRWGYKFRFTAEAEGFTIAVEGQPVVFAEFTERDVSASSFTPRWPTASKGAVWQRFSSTRHCGPPAMGGCELAALVAVMDQLSVARVGRPDRIV